MPSPFFILGGYSDKQPGDRGRRGKCSIASVFCCHSEDRYFVPLRQKRIATPATIAFSGCQKSYYWPYFQLAQCVHNHRTCREWPRQRRWDADSGNEIDI